MQTHVRFESHRSNNPRRKVRARVKHSNQAHARQRKDPNLHVLESIDQFLLVKVQSGLGGGVRRETGHLDVEFATFDEFAGGGVVGDQLDEWSEGRGGEGRREIE